MKVICTLTALAGMCVLLLGAMEPYNNNWMTPGAVLVGASVITWAIQDKANR